VPPGHPAAAILAEFGGLNVGMTTSGGKECGRSDIAFGQPGASEASEIQLWSVLLNSPLVYIAAVQNSHEELYVDGYDRHFGLSMIHDAFYFEGASFGEAVERLLLGFRARPMLRPDQPTVELYGEVFAAGHPSLYRYATGQRREAAPFASPTTIRINYGGLFATQSRQLVKSRSFAVIGPIR
jgi:SUKH-3 immunity protein